MVKLLTGAKIIEEVKNGNIFISDFDEKHVQPNSYDLHWGDELVQIYSNSDNGHDYRFAHPIIDMMEDQNGVRKFIPTTGYILQPDTLYLIPTKERVGSKIYIPQIVGRSSIGRMGIQVSQHAAFGDIGFIGQWTLQVTVVYPTKIYPNLRVCHVFFEEPYGDITKMYHGRYQLSKGAVPSKFNK